MSSAKKSAPAKRAAAPAKASSSKAPAKAPANATAKPAKAPAKPTAVPSAKPAKAASEDAKGKPMERQAFKASATPTPKGTPAPKTDDEAPVPVPAQKLEKQAGRDTLCQIEIVKDGHVFIARTETEAGSKEYKNTVFEDLLTEMLITLQEQMADH